MPKLSYKGGIAHSDELPVNTPAFSQVTGMRVTEGGLVGYEMVPNPLQTWMTAQGISHAAPYPQLIRCQHAAFLIIEAAVYLVDETAWTGSLLTTYDAEDKTTVVTPSGLFAEHVADHGGAVIFGTSQGPLIWFEAAPSKLYLSSTQQTWGVEFRGRYVYVRDAGDTLKMAQVFTQADVPYSSLPPVDASTVAWSTIGGGDYLWWLHPEAYIYGPGVGANLLTNGCFNDGSTGWTLTETTIESAKAHMDGTTPSVLLTSGLSLVEGQKYVVGFHYVSGSGLLRVRKGATGTIGSTSSIGYHWVEFTYDSAVHTGNLEIIGSTAPDLYVDSICIHAVPDEWTLARPFCDQLLLRNECGHRQMRDGGEIVGLHALDSGVVVFTDRGVHALTPAQTDVAGTFAYIQLSWTGIDTARCFAGNRQQVTWVDSLGYVWRMGADLKPARLDYHHIFEDLTGFLLSYDPVRRDLYIYSTTACYLLSPGGLSRTPQAITSLIAEAGQAKGIANPTRLFEGMTLKTMPFDGEDRDWARVTGVECAMTEAGTVTVYPKYRADESITVTTAVLDRRGRAHLNVSGNEFEVGLTAEEHQGLRVPDLKVKIG